MLLLQDLLTWGGIGMIAVAAGILIDDFHREPRIQWRASLALTFLAWGPLLVVAGIVTERAR